jgi:Holliday junction resolvase RusA-like endonuclease
VNREARSQVRSWSATVCTIPRPKGNSKTVLPDFSSPKCPRCQKHARHNAVPRSADKKAERSLAKLLLAVGPPEPFSVDVELLVTIRLPIRKSWTKAKREAARVGSIRPTTSKASSGGSHPDLGNLEKLLDDALEKGGWITNDSLIAARRSEKVYGDEPGYSITIQVLP